MIKPNKEFWDVFKKTPGALSCAEAMSIIQIASLAPSGNYMEVGTYMGKSAMAAALLLKEGNFHLVEPEFENKWMAMGVGASIMNINNKLKLNLIADLSINVIDNFKPYSYFFWDSGEHAGEILQKEKEMLEDAIVSGGIICSHDFKSQFTQQTEAMEYLFRTGKFDWIEIDWQSIFDYVKEHDLENGNNSWHIYNDLPHPPNFVGALKRK